MGKDRRGIRRVLGTIFARGMAVLVRSSIRAGISGAAAGEEAVEEQEDNRSDDGYNEAA
jgi:hypothetical protein